MLKHITTVIGTMRPNFLLLSLVVVLLGSALAVFEGAQWSTTQFVLLLAAALLAHAAVNMQNEYEDYRSGLDSMTQRTPFSGGSGSLQHDPQAAPYVLRTLLVSLLMLVGIGLYFVSIKGWALLPIGLLGVLLIVTYTSKITHMPWLCLITPGLAFGPLMVLGSYYVWMEQFSWSALWLSMVPFFLVNNLLLLNQYPDLQADQKVGRFNILMRLGQRQGSWLFSGFLALSFMMLLLGFWSSALPATVLLGLLSLIIAVPMVRIVSQNYQNIEKLMPALAMNVIINLLTPLLMAAGLFWAMI